ncbi:AAA family ATPase [Pantoea vagans]|uniref:AAA family ATPase n=1 Tax=Pantoea vagans TaxID=470934 RepID=UPI0028E39E16|nr:AAA family ATPase [Pantoea vagans]
MLIRLSGAGYKAFEIFSIDIKPLTILLGANSCGKSAILNAFLMLSQSVDSASLSESPLRLNGNRVGMGEPLNIMKDKNENTLLNFNFEFNDVKGAKSLLDSARRECMEAHFDISRYIFQVLRRNKDIESSVFNSLMEMESLYYRNDIYNFSQMKDINGKTQRLIRRFRKFKETVKISNRSPMAQSNQKYIETVSLQKVEDCLTHLVPLSINRLVAQKVDYSFIYNQRKNTIRIKKCNLFNKSGELVFSIECDGKNELILYSDVISNEIIKRSKSDIKKVLNLDSLLITNIDPYKFYYNNFPGSVPNPVATYINRILSAALRDLSNSLSGNKVNHVSPLRAFPQRYYLLDKAIYHKQLNVLDGTELAEVLRNRPDIKNSINKLFMQFNIAIEVEKVNDIIHKITVNQDAVNLELTDVGFGISQVLPILVQALLSPSNSITIIEQPEIHLHPKMQAWLTDALIYIALEKNIKFIIETHSDALVRRLRLRIVDDSNPLTENDVSIYYLERNRLKNRTDMKLIPVTPDGDISWPSEFMDVEINDTIEIQQKRIEKRLKRTEGDWNA